MSTSHFDIIVIYKSQTKENKGLGIANPNPSVWDTELVLWLTVLFQIMLDLD